MRILSTTKNTTPAFPLSYASGIVVAGDVREIRNFIEVPYDTQRSG